MQAVQRSDGQPLQLGHVGQVLVQHLALILSVQGQSPLAQAAHLSGQVGQHFLFMASEHGQAPSWHAAHWLVLAQHCCWRVGEHPAAGGKGGGSARVGVALFSCPLAYGHGHAAAAACTPLHTMWPRPRIAAARAQSRLLSVHSPHLPSKQSLQFSAVVGQHSFFRMSEQPAPGTGCEDATGVIRAAAPGTLPLASQRQLCARSVAVSRPALGCSPQQQHSAAPLSSLAPAQSIAPLHLPAHHYALAQTRPATHRTSP